MQRKKKTTPRKKVSKAARAAIQRAAALAATNSTLELFLRAVSQLYPMDKLSPGIVLSYLPHDDEPEEKGLFYVSVCRYDVAGAVNPTNPGVKQTLCSAKATSLDAAITSLALMWQGKVEAATKFAGVNVVRRLGKKVQP